MADRKILDLTEIILNRPIVKIDGVEYEMLHPDELSLDGLARIRASGRKLGALGDIESEEAAGQYRALVGEMFRQLFIAYPEDVILKLGPGAHERIIDFFFRETREARAAERANRGGPPSGNSSASTEATPATG